MNEALALLLYHGSALLPLGYLAATLVKGRHRRALLIGLGLQVLASLAVFAFMYWCRGVGYREWYWAVAYNIPVNVLFAIGYVVILCRPHNANPAEPQQPTSS
jgi:hypothetical protein